MSIGRNAPDVSSEQTRFLAPRSGRRRVVHIRHLGL